MWKKVGYLSFCPSSDIFGYTAVFRKITLYDSLTKCTALFVEKPLASLGLRNTTFEVLFFISQS